MLWQRCRRQRHRPADRGNPPGIYGLDRPFLLQYGAWLWKAVHGDLFNRSRPGEAVRSDRALFPHTLLIVAMALACSPWPSAFRLACSQPRSDRFLDRLVGDDRFGRHHAVPNFWLAMILVSLFALKWNIFPRRRVAFGPLRRRHLACALPASRAGGGRHGGSRPPGAGSLLDILSSQFVRTLRAKGLKPSDNPVAAWPQEYRRQLVDRDGPAVQPATGGKPSWSRRCLPFPAWAIHRACRNPARFYRCAGRRLRDGDRRYPGQSADRSSLFGRRSEDWPLIERQFSRFPAKDLRATLAIAYLCAVS